jgi:type IV pilus assembly protein PilW
MNTPKRYQTGFSIISLMIASAIGIFIIGAALKVYIESKNTFDARTAVAAATENYRFAIQDMRRSLVMAGRGISPSDDSSDDYIASDNYLRTFPAVNGNPDGIVSGAETGDSPWSPNPEDSSIIAVRYASGPTPCGLSDGEIESGTSTVRFLVNDEGKLICQVYQNGEKVASRQIVSGIAQMRALYGIDRAGVAPEPNTPDGVADIYLTAKKVNENKADWPKVVSIRIGLIVQSGDGIELPSAFRSSEKKTLDLLDAKFTAQDTSHVYKSASTTISLRNLHHVDRQPSDNQDDL